MPEMEGGELLAIGLCLLLIALFGAAMLALAARPSAGTALLIATLAIALLIALAIILAWGESMVAERMGWKRTLVLAIGAFLGVMGTAALIHLLRRR